MKKFLLSALIGAMSLTAFADSETMAEFGYVNDTYIWGGEGLSYGFDGNIGVAIRIPASAITNYKGGKIIGMKVAAADQANEQEIRAFVRKGSLTSESVTSTTDYITWIPAGGGTGGFSSILFDSEWKIPQDLDEDIYVGLFSTVKADQRILGVSALVQSAKEGTVYISETNNVNDLEPSNWDDIRTIPTINLSNVCIKCIIELPSENYQNVMVMSDAFMPNIASTDKPVNGFFALKNDGPNPIQSFEITSTCGDETFIQTITFEDQAMEPGYITPRPISVPVKVFGTGKHTYAITKVNGQPNDASSTSASASFDIIGVPASESAKHVHRPLYEYYCSESDYRSGVYQDDLLIPSFTPFKNRFTYLPQHSNDKFAQNPIDTPAYVGGEPTTITLTDGDRFLIKISNGINNVIIPSATIDRTIQMSKVEHGGKTMAETPVAGGTPYPQAFYYFINDALAVPTFASVELESDYNPETGIVNIKAGGTIADLLPAGEKAKLSIFIIEETVESDSQEFPQADNIAQLYPGGIFTHARVIRQTVTPFYGDELEPGQDFVKTYSVEIENPRWNTDHMKVVAVIQRPETNDYLHMDVLNTAEEPMSDTYVESGLETIEAERTAAGAVYDLQGRRLTAPMRGINIINGKKILVK